MLKLMGKKSSLREAKHKQEWMLCENPTTPRGENHRKIFSIMFGHISKGWGWYIKYGENI